MAARRRPSVEPNATAPLAMQSVCRNVTVGGRRTSVRMEPLMWDSLMDICHREQRSVHDVVGFVDRKRGDSSLTAALRVFILSYFREATAPASAQALSAVAVAVARSDAFATGGFDPAGSYTPPPRKAGGALSPVFNRAMDIFVTPLPERDDA